MNRYERRLKDLCSKKRSKKSKAIFYAGGLELFNAIKDNAVDILRKDELNIYKIGLKEEKASQIFEMNQRQFDSQGNLTHIGNKSILLRCISRSVTKKDGVISHTPAMNSNSNFVNASISNEDVSYLFTDLTDTFEETNVSYVLEDDNERTTYKSVLVNLWIDNNIIYAFKDDIELQRFEKSADIQTNQFIITSRDGSIDLPTKYESTCNFQSDEDGVCGRNVTWCDAHTSTNVKCTNNIPGLFNGHKISTTSKGAFVSESRTLYIYHGKDALAPPEQNEEMVIYSLFPLSQENVTCNTVMIDDKSGNHFSPLIISCKETSDTSNLDTSLLQERDKDCFCFLEDMFKQLKIYFREHHGITLTNQNKIIAKIMIFQLLTKIFLNKRFHSLIIGTSGSGKTFFSKYLIPLFTFNYKVVYGSQVTRPKFLGGRGEKLINGMHGNSDGYMAVNDCVFLEESSDPLNDYVNTNKKGVDTKNNLFSLFKLADQGGEIGVQGSKPFVPKACAILVGNIEQLEWPEKYSYQIRKKYYNYAKKRLNAKYPMFKSPVWYRDVLDKEELMKAHVTERAELKRHYMTYLPPAEQARFSFCVFLEEPEGMLTTKKIEWNEFQNETDTVKHFHRKELYDELKHMFTWTKTQEKAWLSVQKEIYYWTMMEYLEKEPNNLKMYKDSLINTHLRVSMSHIAGYLIKFQKQYTMKEDSKDISIEDFKKHIEFTENDKNHIRYFLSFNYNSLTMKEASEIHKPRLNYIDVSQSQVFEYDDTKKYEYHAQKKAEEEQMKADDESLVAGDVFGEGGAAKIVHQEPFKTDEDESK